VKKRLIVGMPPFVHPYTFAIVTEGAVHVHSAYRQVAANRLARARDARQLD
jgi:hypothetical protein